MADTDTTDYTLTPEQVDQMKDAAANAAFLRAKQAGTRYENMLTNAGITPPAPPGKSFLHSVMDALATPGRWTRGVIFKELGEPDYADKSFLEAAQQGNEKEASVGDLLRSHNVLQGTDMGSRIARGVTSFAGDVLTDPLSYLTFGESAGAKAGGAVLSKEAVGLQTGEKVLPSEVLARATDNIKQSYLSKFPGMDEAEAGAKASEDAGSLFSLAKSTVKFKNTGQLPEDLQAAADAAGKSDVLGIAARESKVREGLGLASDQPLEGLFEKSGIRYTNPLAGTSVGSLLGPRVADIPIVTPASEQLFDSLSGAYYLANRNVKQVLDATVEAGQKLGGPFNVAANVLQMIRQVPHLISKRLAAGGAAARDIINEHEYRAGQAYYNTVRKASDIFRYADGTPMEDEVLAQGGALLESALRRSLRQGAELTPQQEAQWFEQALGNVTETMGEKGADFAKAARAVRDEFQRRGLMEQDAGVLGDALQSYFQHVYPARDGLDQTKAIDTFVKRTGGPNLSFTLPRTYQTLDQARAAGLMPTTNLRDVYVNRIYQSERALAQKALIERSMYELALPQEAKEFFQGVIANGTDAAAASAKAYLKSQGMELPIQDILKATDEHFQVLKDPRTGAVIDPFHYEELRRMATGGLGETPGGTDLSSVLPQDALEAFIKQEARAKGAQPSDMTSLSLARQAEQVLVPMAERSDSDPKAVAMALQTAQNLGLRFTPEEAQAVNAGYAAYDGARSRLLGRAGEGITDRAGGEMLPDSFKGLIKKMAPRFSDEELNWMNGLLPRQYVNAVQESMDMRSSLTRLADSLSKKGQDPMASPLYKLAEGWVGWMKAFKAGSTIIWPGYFGKLLTFGMPFQAMKSTSVLGESINPLKIWANAQVMRGARDLVLDNGSAIPSKQIIAELSRAGMDANPDTAASLIDTMGTALQSFEQKPTGLGRLFEEKPGVIDGAWQKFQDLSSRVHMFGRQQVYMNLRAQGYDAATAARVSNQTMVDYIGGKTKFEKDVMNNLMFFYSFTRANTSNMIMTMLNKPGALTAQLHAIDGVKEMLADPNLTPLPPDIDKQVQTLRSSELFSRYIGRDAEGVPKFLTNVGVPVEDITRFFNFEAPSDPTSLQSWINAADQSAKRTAESTLSQLAPPLAGALQWASGKNFFYDRPITDNTLRKFPKWESDLTSVISHDPNSIPAQVFNALDKVTQKMLDASDNGDGTFRANPTRLIILTSMFPGVSRAIQTTKALTHSVTDQAPLQGALRATTGIHVQTIEPEKSVAFDRLHQLEDFAAEKGVPLSKRALMQYRALNPSEE